MREESKKPITAKAGKSRSLWGALGLLGGAITTLLTLGNLGSCFGIPSYGELQTRAEARELQQKNEKVHADLDKRVTTIETGLKDRLDSFERFLRRRFPQ